MPCSRRHGNKQASCLLAGTHLELALFIVAAGVLLLLIAGVHNAWDAVAFQVYVVRQQTDDTDA